MIATADSIWLPLHEASNLASLLWIERTMQSAITAGHHCIGISLYQAADTSFVIKKKRKKNKTCQSIVAGKGTWLPGAVHTRHEHCDFAAILNGCGRKRRCEMVWSINYQRISLPAMDRQGWCREWISYLNTVQRVLILLDSWLPCAFSYNANVHAYKCAS